MYYIFIAVLECALSTYKKSLHKTGCRVTLATASCIVFTVSLDCISPRVVSYRDVPYRFVAQEQQALPQSLGVEQAAPSRFV